MFVELERLIFENERSWKAFKRKISTLSNDVYMYVIHAFFYFKEIHQSTQAGIDLLKLSTTEFKIKSKYIV